MKRLLTLLLTNAIVTMTMGSTAPYVIGERTDELTPGDLAEVLALTSPQGSVWLLDVQENWFLKGPNLQARVYLAPDIATPTLRRGRVLWAYQESSSNATGYEWRVSGGPTAWAQVPAVGAKFGSTLTRPRAHDRPFATVGEVSDADLIDLVAYIRTSPSTPSSSTEPEDGSWSIEIGFDVDGKNPIISIEAKAECFMKVTTERRRGAGQEIEVRRTEKGWQVVSVAEWVV